MAFKIEAQIVINGNGCADVKLLDDISHCVTHEEQMLLEKLKPVFRDFICNELDKADLHLLHTYKDECASKATH